MPKRSDRDLYTDAFNGNPYEGHSVEEMYNSIQWEKSPEALYDIDAPEPLVSIGLVAKLITDTEYGTPTYKEKEAPFLAVGKDSNLLYILPKDNDGNPPEEIPEFDPELWRELGAVRETHYFSDKGYQNGYYYHEHEEPFPILFMHEPSGIGMLIPIDIDGKPSYAVIMEGIIG
jgi:hypothetical protein